MSGVGFSELILLFLIGLIVLGPERLPRVANQLGNWLGQARRMTRVMRRQLEDELDLDAKQGSKSNSNRALSKEPGSKPTTPSQTSTVHGPKGIQPTPGTATAPEPAAQTATAVPANEDDDSWSPAHGNADAGTGVGDDAAITEHETASVVGNDESVPAKEKAS